MPTRRLSASPTRARNRARRRRFASALAGVATAVLAGLATVLVGAPAALGEPADPAQPSPDGESAGPPIGPQTPGTEICRVNNAELDEVTGMVARGDVIYVVEGGVSERPSAVTIWTINATTCEATSETYGLSPIDPQDLALGTDGALWVADTGFGQGAERSWVTFERVDLSSGANAVAYRALYPASGAVNGTAVVLDDNNQPIIIANVGQSALIFRANAPLPADTTENLPTLEQVGQFTPVRTDTPTPRGAFGHMVVTGAAMSPDRTKVVLRTESDAYEFTITNGDIVASITEGTPTITPLPNEEQGQAITYSADGSQLLTLSGSENPVLRAYTPYVPPAEPAGEVPGSGGGGGSRLSFDDITTIAMITGFIGLAAVVVGVVGIVRARRQYFAENPDGRTRTRGPRDSRGRGDRRDRRGTGRERWDIDDEEDDEYGDDYGSSRSAWPPRPRDHDHDWSDEPAPARSARASAHGGPMHGGPMHGGAAHGGADDDYGDYDYGGAPAGGATYGAAGGGGGRVYGSGTTYGSSGTTYGSSSAGHDAGGTTYGSGGTTYGSSGTTYGSSGGTYRSGGTTYGSSSSGHGSGRSGGGVYGRPRSDWDDDEPRRPYGRDNVDL